MMLSDKDLKRQIRENRIGKLYLLYGSDQFSLKHRAAQLIDCCDTGTFSDFNLHRMTNAHSVQEIADAVEALPLMAERSCVAVADFDLAEKNATEKEQLLELIQAVPETTVLIFYYPTVSFSEKSPDYRKWVKALDRLGQVVSFPQKTAGELGGLLQRKAAQRDCRLSKENAARMISYLGTDLQLLQNEMEKLCAFTLGRASQAGEPSGTGASSGGEGMRLEITRSVIEELIPVPAEGTVFQLSTALLSGNAETAFQYLNRLLANREEPVAILAVLSMAYVDRYRVLAATESGASYQAVMQYGDYKGKDFRLRKAQQNLRGVSRKQLGESLEILLRTDRRLKSSGGDPQILLEQMMLELLILARKGGRK